MKLYNFHASSASFRVRIALALKKLDYEYVPVKLALTRGEHEAPAYRDLNPQGFVPALVDGDLTIAQTGAIFEHLEETVPDPPLLPADRAGRARVRGLALLVACEIQPLGNLRIERHLTGDLSFDADGVRAWRRHWIAAGFDVIERELTRSESTGRYCHGDRPTMADCFLVPQVYNSQRPNVGLDLPTWPTIERVYRTCLATPEFDAAHPMNQPDAPIGSA